MKFGQLALLGIVALMIPLSFIQAAYPEELLLQHVPTVVGLGLISVLVVFRDPSALSYVCFTSFLILHIIGARWIYSFVPYDDLSVAIFGQSLSETFGWRRNHYDRFVHFASGLLGVPPLSELLQRVCGLRPLAAILAGTSVMAIGALYEILEWQIAMLFSPKMAEAYNGQQGDIWDPQKDLALALIGATVGIALVFRWVPPGIQRKAAGQSSKDNA